MGTVMMLKIFLVSALVLSVGAEVDGPRDALGRVRRDNVFDDPWLESSYEDGDAIEGDLSDDESVYRVDPPRIRRDSDGNIFRRHAEKKAVRAFGRVRRQADKKNSIKM